MSSTAKLRKKRRLYLVLAGLLVLGTVTSLTLTALDETLVFFYSPSDLKAKSLKPGQVIRLGGLVAEGSLERHDAKMQVQFVVTDMAEDVTVTYAGILPDLFREGQGVVAQGSFQGQMFHAQSVLAKHDENYMPKEVTEALKKTGHWQHTDAE